MTTAATPEQTAKDLTDFQENLIGDSTLQQLMLQDPYQTMIANGVPEATVATFLAPSTGAETTSDIAIGNTGLSVTGFWWGIQIGLTSQLCTEIEGGLTAATGLAAGIAAVMPPLMPISGIIGGTLTGMIGVLMIFDKGKGVHFDLNWIELAEAGVTVGMSLPASMIPISN